VTFQSPDYPLHQLLSETRKLAIQLPDFQREWKWDDEHIRSLLASVSQGYPIGVMMMLETDPANTSFASQPLAGTEGSRSPDLLLLDGQQRLTSLFQAIASGKPVDTTDSKGKKLKRWYYIDMRAVLANGDREEAILSVPEDRKIRDNFGKDVVADYSTLADEVRHEVFPISRIFDTPALFEWQNAYVSVDPEHSADRQDRWNRFFKLAIEPFTQYLVPVIVLGRHTPKEAVCTVFEKVNTGGVPLNVFELLTATFAIDGYRLKDDWDARAARLREKPVLQGLENTEFLQVVTLLATWDRKRAFSGPVDDQPAVSCKRKDILKLTLEEYERWAEPATDGLLWAASFLAHEHIFSARDLPYKSQLVPLAAIRAIVGASIDDHGTNALLRRWYWSGVLGELYGASTETRFARDVEQVPAWLVGGPVPKTVDEALFHASRLLTLRTRNSAAYKGIYALLLREGAIDWQKHQKLDMATFFDHRIDIHHIFPKAWCNKAGVPAAQRESIVNKTAISASTNRSIGGRAPSEYLRTLERNAKISSEELDAIIATHAIDPRYLRTDDFDGFFADRTERLLALVSKAMGKEAIREDLAGQLEGEHRTATRGEAPARAWSAPSVTPAPAAAAPAGEGNPQPPPWAPTEEEPRWDSAGTFGRSE